MARKEVDLGGKRMAPAVAPEAPQAAEVELAVVVETPQAEKPKRAQKRDGGGDGQA